MNEKRPRADLYGLSDDGLVFTELELLAEALSEREPVTFAEALDKLTSENGELYDLHVAWRASVADGDYERLPRWLHGSLTAALLKRKRLLEARAQTSRGYTFEQCVEQYAAGLRQRGVPAHQARERARRELADVFVDVS